MIRQKPTSTFRHNLRALLHSRKLKMFVAGSLLLVFATLQFAVPSDYVMPRARIGSETIGFTKTETLRQKLSESSKKISVDIDRKNRTFDAAEVGIKTDVDATIKGAPTLTLKDKLIPFKPLYLLVRSHEVKPVVRKDHAAVSAFAADLSRKLSAEPIDAKPEIKDGGLTIIKSNEGTEFDEELIKKELLNKQPYSGNAYVITSKTIPAQVTEKDLKPLKDEYEKKTSQTMEVKYGETTKKVDSQTLQTWFEVSQDPETGKWLLRPAVPAIEAQIQLWATEYNIAPGITQVSYHDDRETFRRNGTAGRAIEVEAVKNQIQKWFDEPTTQPLVLASAAVAPRINATYTYSRSSAQLQAQLNAWIASQSGSYQIAIRELNGRGREASHNVSQQTVMASTYKIFLAFAAYRQAESGALNMNTTIAGSRNVEQCIEVMIVNSDNDCPVKLGRYIGWAKVDQIIAAAGFQNILLNNYDSAGNLKGDKLVNATEQAKFLSQLSGGSLINSTHTNRLLNYMKRQTYREGIPAGSRGAVVADKVGFLDAYIHDVGIVYGPKSTYALVIMSEGSNWSKIRSLATAVYDFMNE